MASKLKSTVWIFCWLSQDFHFWLNCPFNKLKSDFTGVRSTAVFNEVLHNQWQVGEVWRTYKLKYRRLKEQQNKHYSHFQTHPCYKVVLWWVEMSTYTSHAVAVKYPLLFLCGTAESSYTLSHSAYGLYNIQPHTRTKLNFYHDLF